MPDNLVLQRLASQIRQARAILFTGAGFSLDAQSRSGNRLPTAGQLTADLWEIAFPGEDHDGSGLQDTFEAAVSQAQNATVELLRDRLTVDSATLAAHYELWFSMPWYRVYTLNIDDLPEAADRAFDLPRRVQPISALSDPFINPDGALQVVHLNGRLADLPDTTFSGRQYAQRLARSDVWYANLSREIPHHPIVFVGTTLDEPPLWQYVEERGMKPARGRELRPGGLLVTLNLPRAKAVALGRYNIDYVDMTAAAFAADVLSQIEDAAAEGLRELARARMEGHEVLEDLNAVRDDSQNDAREYLLGREPRWSDITDGFAVEREFDASIASSVLDSTRLVAVTGTAGSGKSTTAMRLVLALSAAGKTVFRLAPDAPSYIRRIRNAVSATKPDVLFIDDADRFGENLPALIQELREDVPDTLIICALRSARYEGTGLARLIEDESGWAVEAVAPPLADPDVDGILDALTRANRLGELRGKSPAEQRRVLVEKCGRQLLVALIEATSGKRFDEKVESECAGLDGETQLLYAIAALATNFSIPLTDAELLTAAGGDVAVAVRSLDTLVRTHLLVRDRKQRLRLRHKVIAERAVEYFKSQRLVEVPLAGLVVSLATSARGRPLRDTFQGRAVIRLINHKLLIEFLRQADGAFGSQPDLAAIRAVYDEVEDLLSDDYHFWLQRASFETEQGDLDAANNFIRQARGLNPEDPYVRTQWAYTTIKTAANTPDDPASRTHVAQAFDELDEAIEQRGRADAYPFHIYGSQGLAWSNRGPLTRDERAELLQTLRRVVDDGIALHPKRRDLRQLAADLKDAYLRLAVV